MRQLVYAMRFTGRATPASPDGGVLTVRATASSSVFTTIIGADGLVGQIESIAGGEGTFASEVTLTGATSFQEVGSISIGDRHRLRFSTIGSGYLGAWTDRAQRHGAVVWQVAGGEGQFVGARGLITTHIAIGDGGEVTAHHLGVIFLLEGLMPLMPLPTETALAVEREP